jgi:hypothetical protein
MHDVMTSGNAGKGLPTVASHQRAVARMYRGSVALYAGVGSLAMVLLGNVLGGTGTAHKVAVVGAGALVFGGLVMIGTAAPHLIRFGRSSADSSRSAVPCLFRTSIVERNLAK